MPSYDNDGEDACAVCGETHTPERLLICDGCSTAYHTFCLKKKLSAVPKDDWFCSACAKKKGKGAASERSKGAAKGAAKGTGKGQFRGGTKSNTRANSDRKGAARSKVGKKVQKLLKTTTYGNQGVTVKRWDPERHMTYNFKEMNRQRHLKLIQFVQDGDLLLDVERSDLLSIQDRMHGHKILFGRQNPTL